MVKNILLASSAWTLIALICMHIPLVNIPFVYLAMPLFDVADFLGLDESHIEWYFFGPLLKTPYALALISAYYWTTGIPAYLVIGIVMYRDRLQQKDHSNAKKKTI